MKGEKILHSKHESKVMTLVTEVHLAIMCKYRRKYLVLLSHAYCQYTVLCRGLQRTLGMCQTYATQHNIFDTHSLARKRSGSARKKTPEDFSRNLAITKLSKCGYYD